MLNKNQALFENKDGELVPQEIELQERVDDKVETIKIIPITRKEMKELFEKNKDKGETDEDSDALIVKKYCKEPIFLDEEIKVMKPTFVKNIAQTIFDFSIVRDFEKPDIIKRLVVLNPIFNSLNLMGRTRHELLLMEEYEKKVKELSEKVAKLELK